MKKNKRVIFNGAFLLIVFVLTIYGVFHGEDLGAMMDAIRSADKRWLVPGLALVAFFIWGESIIIWYMMRSYGIKLKKRTCFLFSSVGFFFSCITPSASGGQPMQAYYMKKKNISIPVSAVILMIITITYKLVLVVVGIGVAVFGRGFLHQYLEGILPVFYLGLGLNIFCVTFMTILVFHPLLARSALVWGLSILEKFHILRHKEGRLKKLEDSMDTYRDTSYTVAELLKNPVLAKRYEGGLLWVFRLCVDDYHRYIYIDDGFESRRVHIPGELHTVNPVANDVYPIYKENTREYALLKTVNFGTVLMMEVGALMVGRIENVPLRGRVKRGKEKGNFAFGGSTVILMTQKERVLPDPDIFMNSEKGIETRVKLGERIGVSEVLDG